MNKRTITVTIMDDDENETEHELPATNEVCSRCEGFGTHTNPNIDGNGITASEWAEWDSEEQETYMNGGYDVTCEECHGNKVVLMIDEKVLTPEQKVIAEQWEDQEEERYNADADWRREQEMESRMLGEY
jgi:hypothetical protein